MLAHLRVVSQLQVCTLWVEGSGAAGKNMGLIKRLQQPHEVGAVRLKTTPKTRFHGASLGFKSLLISTVSILLFDF